MYATTTALLALPDLALEAVLGHLDRTSCVRLGAACTQLREPAQRALVGRMFGGPLYPTCRLQASAKAWLYASAAAATHDRGGETEQVVRVALRGPYEPGERDLQLCGHLPAGHALVQHIQNDAQELAPGVSYALCQPGPLLACVLGSGALAAGLRVDARPWWCV